jgi:hypothetical protein
LVSTPYGTEAAPSFLGSFLQSGEVFLQERFVLAVLYVQLRACPVGVYGRAFLDFRKMFSATKKSRASLDRGSGTDGTFSRFQELLRPKNGECPVCPRFICPRFIWQGPDAKKNKTSLRRVKVFLLDNPFYRTRHLLGSSKLLRIISYGQAAH